MPILFDGVLSRTRDKNKGTVRFKADVWLWWSDLELALMNSYPDQRFFRLKCKLVGADYASDNILYTLEQRFYFPDGQMPPEQTECVFDETVGEGVVDEDAVGRDEIYARFYLYSYLTSKTIEKSFTNTVYLHI